jgi:hypothetical protein
MRAVRIAFSFALEETARDLPGGVHALLHVHCEREEVSALTGLHPPHRGREHHRIARADEHGSVRLLGELARFEGDLVAADSRRDTRVASNHHAHVLPPCPSRKAEAEV